MRIQSRLNLLVVPVLSVSTLGALAQGTAPVYLTPQAALEALTDAMHTGSVEAAISAIDPSASDLVQSDDPAVQAATMQDLLAQYLAGYRFVPDSDGSITIELGTDGWPFPVPLVEVAGGWQFDAEAGRDEIRGREIGGNELEVIDVLQAYVEIQADYRKTDHDGDGVLEFAASLISSDGRRDGLFWPGDDSPVGDVAARASLDGYSEDGIDSLGEPLFGYYFRVLTSQGPTAPGGAMSYLVNGNMVAGHAALAVPAEYGATGLHSFIVSENGTVYQSDLGEQSMEVGLAITVFDPANGWEPTK